MHFKGGGEFVKKTFGNYHRVCETTAIDGEDKNIRSDRHLYGNYNNNIIEGIHSCRGERERKRKETTMIMT